MDDLKVFLDSDLPDLDEGFGLHQLIYIFRRRRWVFLTTFVAVIVGSYIFRQYQEPRHWATATLIIEPEISHLSDLDRDARNNSSEFYESQYETVVVSIFLCGGSSSLIV